MDCCANTTDEKVLVNFVQGTLTQQPICGARRRQVGIPAFIVCAGIIQQMGISQCRLLLNIDYYPSMSGKNSVNFGPVTPEIMLLICISGWVHTRPKYARFQCFHKSAWIDLCQTFRKYRGVSRLHNKKILLAQVMLLW